MSTLTTINVLSFHKTSKHFVTYIVNPIIAARSISNQIDHKKINPDPNLISTRNAPSDFDKSTAVVYHHPSIISQYESEVLLSDIQKRTSRKRYQKGHWDSVISGYKEVELFQEDLLSDVSEAVITRIRHFLERKHLNHNTDVKWLPCHAIELKEDGFLKPHVDSVKFSGDVVCGLSLLSPSIMRLKKENDENDGCHIDLLLLPSSLYVLSGEGRYSYTHELLDSSSEFCSDLEKNPSIVHRSKRISLIFRDTKDE